jgi:UPF0755 protein
VAQVRLTIPEGFNISQEAIRVRDVVGIPKEAFTDAALSGTFALEPYLPAGTPTVEGFLFPNTYFLFADATPQQVIDVQLAEFKKEADASRWDPTPCSAR